MRNNIDSKTFLQSEISYYEKISPHSNLTTTIGDVLDEIKSPDLEDKDSNRRIVTIEKLRKLVKEDPDQEIHKKQIGDLKRSLDSFTTSGEFSARYDDQCTKHSGLIQIDVDGKDNRHLSCDEIFSIVRDCPHIAAVFRSPGGDGVKGIGLCPDDVDCHKGSHEAFKHYFSEKGVEIDDKTKNLSRACFLSHDPDLVVKDTATCITPKEVAKKKERSTQPVSKTPVKESLIHSTLETLADERRGQFDDYEDWMKCSSYVRGAYGDDAKYAADTMERYFPSEGEQNAHDLSQESSSYPLPFHGIEILLENEDAIKRVRHDRFPASFWNGVKTPRQKALERREATSSNFVLANQMETSLDLGDFVEGLLTEGALSVVYGPSNVGKSFFALDLASCVAASIPFADREVEGGSVLYVALEGSHGAKNRVSVLKRMGRDLSNLAFTFAPISLYEEGGASFVIEISSEIEELLGKPVKMIIIDTLSRAMAGGDENSPVDMTTAIQNIDRIRQRTDCHVMVIHHSGKDASKGARGHSSLRAATDTEIEIEKIDERKIERASLAKNTKQRDLDCSTHIPFQLEVEELGKNKRGRAVTSCKVNYLNPSEFSDVKGQRIKHEPEDLLQFLPCNSGDWESSAKDELGINKNPFFALKKILEEQKKVRCEKKGKERIFHAVRAGDKLLQKFKFKQNTKLQENS